MRELDAVASASSSLLDLYESRRRLLKAVKGLRQERFRKVSVRLLKVVPYRSKVHCSRELVSSKNWRAGKAVPP